MKRPLTKVLLLSLFGMSLLVLGPARHVVSAAAAESCNDNGNDNDKSPSVQNLLRQSSDDIVSFLGTIYEHSPWVAEALIIEYKDLWASWTTVTQLAAALQAIVDQSTYEQKLALLQAHPDLRDKVNDNNAVAALTPESQHEQSQAGLDTMTETELQTFHQLNTAYKTKFPFPFILAVRNVSKYTILAALKGRLGQTVEAEFTQALQQVHKIAWMRLLAKLDTSDAQGFLTCHVLDTANGIPGTWFIAFVWQVALSVSSVCVCVCVCV